MPRTNPEDKILEEWKRVRSAVKIHGDEEAMDNHLCAAVELLACLVKSVDALTRRIAYHADILENKL